MSAIVPILDTALALAGEVLKLVNAKNATKYIDRIYSLKKDISEEESKGQNSDDAKIEALYAELKTTVEVAKDEILLILASNK